MLAGKIGFPGPSKIMDASFTKKKYSLFPLHAYIIFPPAPFNQNSSCESWYCWERERAFQSWVVKDVSKLSSILRPSKLMDLPISQYKALYFRYLPDLLSSLRLLSLSRNQINCLLHFLIDWFWNETFFNISWNR